MCSTKSSIFHLQNLTCFLNAFLNVIIDLNHSPVFSPILCISIVYFRWVNTLGMAALHGIDVVLRHSFFDYGYTHLVDQHFNPLPVSFSFSIQQG